MDSKDVVTGLKRYINNKSTNTQKFVKDIDKKINNLSTAIVKMFKMMENQEKKIKAMALYQYKIMKVLDNMSSTSNEQQQLDSPMSNLSKSNVSEKSVNDTVDVPELDLPQPSVVQVIENNKKKPKPVKKVNKTKSKNDNEGERLELKKEFLKVDEDVVKKCLKNCDINSDVILFKKIYVNDSSECPIRYINKNNFQYWADGRWYDDAAGEKITDIIVSNIKKLYIKANVYENFQGNLYKYQTYIGKMNEKKYKDTFIKMIKDLIKI